MNHFTKEPRKVSEETKEFRVFLGVIKELLSSQFLKICKNEKLYIFFLPIQFSLLIYPEEEK